MVALRNLSWLYLSFASSVLVLTAVFYILERLAPAEPGQTLSQRLFNATYYPFLLAWLLLLQLVLAPVYSFFLQASRGGLLSRFIDLPRGFAAQLLFALL